MWSFSNKFGEISYKNEQQHFHDKMGLRLKALSVAHTLGKPWLTILTLPLDKADTKGHLEVDTCQGDRPHKYFGHDVPILPHIDDHLGEFRE